MSKLLAKAKKNVAKCGHKMYMIICIFLSCVVICFDDYMYEAVRVAFKSKLSK